ncbi:MAG: hypothetical protein ACI9U2_002037 [Bradymonadia bacterium]
MRHHPTLPLRHLCAGCSVVTAALLPLLSVILAQPILTPDEQAAIDAAFAAPTRPVLTANRTPPPNSNPRIALILDVAAAVFDGAPEQTGAHDPNKTGFTLQQLEMHLESTVDPYFELQANIVFAQFGVEVEEAYARTLALPGDLQVKAGQFLTAMGRLNPTHPHAWQFLDQPLVNGKFFGGEGSRGMGAELSWLSPLPWYVLISGAAHDAAGGCCARSFFGGEDLGVAGVGDLLYTTRLEQFFPFNPSLSLSWGLNAQHGPNATGNDNRTAIYGSDLYLRWRPIGDPGRLSVSWQTEAFYRTRQVPADRLEDMGLYSQVVVEFALRWAIGARVEHVTGISNDPLDPDWTAHRQRYAAQATFYPSHFSRLRLQASLDDRGAVQVPAVMLGLETLIGAHGAHGF